MMHDRPLTFVGPATPPQGWCLPDAEPSWDHTSPNSSAAERYARGTRTFPEDEPHADVWIQAEDGTIGCRVMPVRRGS